MPLIQINNPQASNFLNQVYQSNDVVCFYYWNSCGHCQAFKPVFYDVIQNLQERRDNLFDNMIVIEVEYDDFKYLPPELTNVSAFPSVVSIEKGVKKDEFSDQRTPEKLREFITANKSLSSPSSQNSSKRQLKVYTSKK